MLLTGNHSLLLVSLLVPLSMFSLSACSATRAQKTSYPPGYPGGFVERGEASWYGPGFHGNKTANGETYDMHQMTAAHRTLPLGSIVKVRSLTNGTEVTVRINDRGPFARGRILDLSLAGARGLGMVGNGTDRVEIRVIEYLGSWNQAPLRVQLASFSELARAQAMLTELEISHFNGRIVQTNEQGGGARYRVQAGYFHSEDQAEAAARRLGALFHLNPLIVRDDF